MSAMPDLLSDEPTPPVELVITTESGADALVLALYGELDLATAPVFERQLEHARSTRPECLVVDLSGLQFMDSSGLHALLRATRPAPESGQQLQLLRGSRAIERVFELTGTAGLFSFVD